MHLSTLIIVMCNDGPISMVELVFNIRICNNTLFQHDNNSLRMEEVAYETLCKEDKLKSGGSKFI